jgi:hypothetical protein
MRAVISVAALPMSICPQAMSYLRPSSEMHLVSPVMACLVAVYRARSWARRMRGYGAIVDDAPAARRLHFHEPDGFLRAQKRAGQIDAHHRAPLLVGEILHGMPGAPMPALLKSRSSRPNASLRFGEERAHGFGIADIGGHGEHAAAAGTSHGRGLL